MKLVLKKILLGCTMYLMASQALGRIPDSTDPACEGGGFFAYCQNGRGVYTHDGEFDGIICRTVSCSTNPGGSSGGGSSGGSSGSSMSKGAKFAQCLGLSSASEGDRCAQALNNCGWNACFRATGRQCELFEMLATFAGSLLPNSSLTMCMKDTGCRNAVSVTNLPFIGEVVTPNLAVPGCVDAYNKS